MFSWILDNLLIIHRYLHICNSFSCLDGEKRSVSQGKVWKTKYGSKWYLIYRQKNRCSYCSWLLRWLYCRCSWSWGWYYLQPRASYSWTPSNGFGCIRFIPCDLFKDRHKPCILDKWVTKYLIRALAKLYVNCWLNYWSCSDLSIHEDVRETINYRVDTRVNFRHFNWRYSSFWIS